MSTHDTFGLSICHEYASIRHEQKKRILYGRSTFRSFAVLILLQLHSHGSFSVEVEDDLKLVSQPYFALLRGEQCTANSCVGHKILQNWALLGP